MQHYASIIIDNLWIRQSETWKKSTILLHYFSNPHHETIVYITSCFGVDDSFFEDVDNDLSGYKVYRANPKNVNEANLLAELHKSSKVVLIWLMKYTDQVRVSVWFLEWFWYNGCPW